MKTRAGSHNPQSLRAVSPIVVSSRFDSRSIIGWWRFDKPLLHQPSKHRSSTGILGSGSGFWDSQAVFITVVRTKPTKPTKLYPPV